MPVKNGAEEVIERRVGGHLEANPWGTRGGRRSESSQNRILIKGGRIVNDDQMFDADVYVEEGIIKQVGQSLVVPGGCKTLDARGQYVLPGGIDVNTHLQFPSMGTRTVDDFYSGTKAALAGGTTMIIDHVTPEPGSSLLEGYDKWRAWADERVCCDYSFHMSVTSWKDGITDKEMEILVKEKGINSFKCAMANPNMLRDPELLKVFDICKRLGALAMVHAENGDAIDYLEKKLIRMGVTGPEGHIQARPEEVEAEAIHRAVTLAHQVGAPLCVSPVMSKSGADEVTRGRQRGCLVFGEANAAALGTDGSHLFNRCWRHAAGHIMSPPLRADRTTPEYLMNSLGAGQLQVTGSDHCVFSGSQKALGEKNFTKIPNGVNGVEERLMIIWEKGVKTGKLSPQQFVAVTSSNAARLFNIYPKKGRIAVNADADLVIWGKKPKTIKADTHRSAVDFNIFEGITVEFSPLAVISNGRMVLDEDGRMVVSQGSGRFINTPSYAPFIFHRVHERDLNMAPTKVDRSTEVVKANGNNNVPPNTPSGKAAAPNNLPVEGPITAMKISDNNACNRTVETGSPVPSGSPTPSTPGSGILTPTGFHKIHTRSGVRNMQDSTFRLTGEQIDDDRMSRTAIKVANPPGGRSSGLW